MLLDKSFKFGAGCHDTREQGMCVMEAVAYLAGEPHSDFPKCADLMITLLAQRLNDCCNDAQRAELCADLPWRIIGTVASESVLKRRIEMAIRWISERSEIAFANPWGLPLSYCQAGNFTDAAHYTSHCIRTRNLIDNRANLVALRQLIVDMIELTEPKEATVSQATTHV